MSRMAVVLPAPLGPSRPNTSPRSMTRLRLCTAAFAFVAPCKFKYSCALDLSLTPASGGAAQEQNSVGYDWHQMVADAVDMTLAGRSRPVVDEHFSEPVRYL